MDTPAADFTLPPIDGRISGDLTVTKRPGISKLHWTVESHGVAAGRRHASIVITAKGLQAQLEAEVNEHADGAWRIAEGTLDAAEWFPVLAAEIGPALDGIAATGRWVLTGSGELASGRPTGRVKFSWSDGSLRHAMEGWTLQGIGMSGEFDIDPVGGTGRSAGPFELSIKTITTARFGARNAFVRALLNPDRTVSLQQARIEIAGGEVTIDPGTIPLSPLVVDVTLHVARVGLQDVAALVPTVLAEARGRVDGMINLGWSEVDGFRLGRGHLSVRHDEPAEVRLAPTPGLISSSLPTAALKYYPGLGKIETGEIPLRADVLDVTFTPEGDAEGRTATVHLAGGPVDPKLRAPVDLTVNVRGPLDSLIKLGTSSKLHFGGGK